MKLWTFILLAALLCMALATVLSAFSFAATQALGAFATRRIHGYVLPTPWDLIKTTLLMCAITVVWFGGFGFVAGGLGAAVLHGRRRRIRSLKRLLMESCVLGLLFAVAFPFCDAAIRAYPLRYWGYAYSGFQGLLILLLCPTSAMICALVFRRRFVSPEETLAG